MDDNRSSWKSLAALTAIVSTLCITVAGAGSASEMRSEAPIQPVPSGSKQYVSFQRSGTQAPNTATVAPPGRRLAPPLTNARNPVSFGADPGGGRNSARAFQKALDGGDLDVPAGLFRIDSTVYVPSNRNIKCEPGAALEYTTTGNIAMFNWSGTSVGSVFGCQFRGTNYNIKGKPAESDAFQEFIFVQSIEGKGGSDLTIANNDFNGIGGFIGAIQLFSSDRNEPGPHDNLITHNSFEHCGLYAVQLVSGRNNIISHNDLTDCNGFVEADNLRQATIGNLIDHNTLTFVYGVGQWGPGLPGYNELSCGASPEGFDYSGNTCSNNVVSGSANVPAHIIESVPRGLRARYTNNSCSTGCTKM
jgi:hypothetical protein